MPRPFEIASADLQDHLEELVDATSPIFSPQFLVLPRATTLSSIKSSRMPMRFSGGEQTPSLISQKSVCGPHFARTACAS